jgi:hypothetical protein
MAYSAEILRQYIRLPLTPDRPRRADRLLAADLQRRQVPLATVRAALLIGSARRAFSSTPSLTPIRSLHYFLPVLDEIQQGKPIDPDYIDYLEKRLIDASQETL